MFKKSHLKGFISGFIVAILITNVAFAAVSSKNIKVVFDNIRMIFNGVEKVPAADSKPLTYNGKIYVPLDYAAKSIGKNYEWDAKSKTAYIGLTKNEITNGIVAKTSDGLAQLKFPFGWKDDGSDGQIILSYSKGTIGNMMVLRDNKSALSNDATIDNYCTIITNNMANELQNAVITEPSQININNYSALQLEIQGEIQKVKLKYLVTIVATNDSYYQLVAYSTQDSYNKNKSDFEKIMNTFKEVSK